MIVIYQDLPTPTSNGHFSNSPSTPRTLEIEFSSPTNFSDNVTYLGSNLIGGNGVRADFEWNGTVSYANDGCQAPIISGAVAINSVTNGGNATTSICAGDELNLSAITIGSYDEVFWEGGDGSFVSPSSLATTYNSTLNEDPNFDLIVSIVLACNDTIRDTVSINIISSTRKSVTPVTQDICPGGSATITASGGTSYLWSY